MSQSDFLWSVMIPTFNRVDMLKVALQSVLEQYEQELNMEIWVVDDCSDKEDTKALVDEMGIGKVNYYMQPKNVGQIKNLNTCIDLAKGKLVHILHNDDFVLPGFYQKITAAYNEFPDAGAYFCRNVFVDHSANWQYLSPMYSSKSGVIENWYQMICVSNCIQTPAMVVRSDVYKKLGGFDSNLSWTEDWEMWVRLSGPFKVYYINQVLAAYRDAENSNTANSIVTGRFITDLKKVIDVNFGHHKNETYHKQSLDYYSKYILQRLQYLSLSTIGTKGFFNICSKAFQFNTSLGARLSVFAKLIAAIIEKVKYKLLNA